MVSLETVMIFIRVDGANIKEIGMGHLYRMMFLANQLFQKTGTSPMFVISGYQETKTLLDCNHLKYIEINRKDEANEILKLSGLPKKDILIIDMCDRDDAFIRKLTEKYFVVSFDDTKGGVRYSDIVINSVVEGKFERENFYSGTEYFLIRQEIGKYNLKKKNILNSIKTILISLGGSDPCSLNFKMIDWLKELKFPGKINWVLGPSVNDKELIIERFNDLNLNIFPLIDYKDMGELYYHSDLCVSAAGFGLYEVACVGLPVISVCLYSHQVPTAKKFEERGCAFNLGYYKEFTQDTLKSAVLKLIDNQSLRSSMSRNGKEYVDGMGINRVLNIINKTL